MPRKKQPETGPKKLSNWLRPWANKQNPSETKNGPPPEDKKTIRPKSSENEKRIKKESQLDLKSQKEELISTPMTPIEEKSKPDWELSSPNQNSDKTSKSPIKPRSLGTTNVASQPISIPIKKTLDIMIDTVNRVKGAPITQHDNKLQSQPESPTLSESSKYENPKAFVIEEPQLNAKDISAHESADISRKDPTPLQSSPSFQHSKEPHQDRGVTPQETLNQRPITDTLSDIRHIKIWSLDSELVEYKEKPTDELFSEAITLYQLGLAGDKEAVPQAFKLLIHVLQKDRRNLLAEAYLGSVIALMGRDAQDNNDRFKLVIKALKILDKVVSLEPEHIEIRGLRAFVCAKLPEQYFHRTDTAIEDFSYLVSRYDEDDSLLPQEFYYQILFELVLAYHRLGMAKEAESTCRKLLSLTNDPKYKTLIKQEGILQSDLPKWQKKLERRSDTKNEWTQVMDDEKLEEGIALHNRAVEDDALALQKAFDIFKQLHKRNPLNPLISAYYADCLSLLGLSVSDTSIMFRHVTHAIKTLDQAVNSCPDNITIRLIRGNNSYRIPEAFFRRTLTAIRDFEYIHQRYEKDPELLSEETYLKILYDLGDAYERLEMVEEAQATWRKLSQSGDTPYKQIIDELVEVSPADSQTTLHDELTPSELLQKGIRLHELALTGNTQAGTKAYEVLRKAYQANMTNPLAQGYFGSSMAIFGQHLTDPSEMYRHFFKGMDHLKKAISNDPKNYTLHLLLANVMYHYSPSFFRGNEKIINEFKFLKTAYERDNTVFSEEAYLQILYDLGACYQNSGEPEKAKKCWEKLSKLTINPKYTKLQELEQEGEVDMDKDKIRDKFKEIAIDIAQEKAKEKAERRKEKKRSKEGGTEIGTDATTEKPRRKRKEREKENVTPVVTETTERKRKKDRKKDEVAPVVTETNEHKRKKDRKKEQPQVQEVVKEKLSPEEKKARREEKEKARAEKIQKALDRAKRVKKEDVPTATEEPKE